MTSWVAVSRAAIRLLPCCLVVAALLAGCSRDGFEDRTAVVTVGADTVRFQVDSCGLDEQTLFVVGRSDRGEILQAVIGLGENGSTTNPGSTGLTVEVGADTYAAFGETAWDLRDGPGDAPGSVSSGRLRGARIELAGRAELVDDEGRTMTGPGASEVAISLDARCDERDG